MTVRGTLYIISAPSGAGKTTLVRALVAGDPCIKVSISHTTRKARESEQDGVDYHFVEPKDFEKIRDQGIFLEYAEVFGHSYGTSKSWVEGQLELGLDVILEIDWQGARRIKEAFSCTSVFILPPSRAALLERLTNRKLDSPDVIQARMGKASSEISHYHEYDYIIVNDDFDIALTDLKSIIRTQRISMSAQRERQQGLINELLL